MPLYEYACADCGAVLEVFQQPGDHDPKLCGYRCVLGPEDGSDARGFGALTRTLSVPGGIVSNAVRKNHPGFEDAAKAGFTTYTNEGGKLVRRSGHGPKVIKEDS